MKKENKELLEMVINDRLTKSLEGNADERQAAFEEAMQAVDRQNEIDSKKKERLLKLVEIGAVVIAAPIIDATCKKAFAQVICEFEQTNLFSSMAGKSLSGLFKFKK